MATALESQIQIKNILFAADFTSAGAQAVPYVRALARRYGANVVTLHVRPPVVNPMTQPASWEADIAAAKALDEHHREELLQTFKGLPTQVIIGEGPMRSRIESAISEHNIDLMVVGTHGRTGVGKFFLGSVAEELFRTVTCPVLTVGPHVSPEEPESSDFRRVLYATEVPGSERVAAYAALFANEYHFDLALLHVVAPERHDAEPEFGRDEEIKQQLRELISAEVQKGCNTKYLVAHGTVADEILGAADSMAADLIVLGAKPGKGLIGATHLPMAVAHKVVAAATCPVLIIRNEPSAGAEKI